MECKTCGIEKEVEDFEWQKDRPNPRTTCRLCRQKNRVITTEQRLYRQAQSKTARKERPVAVRQSWERSVYGACKEDFNYSNCYICGSTKRIHLDHNHATGEVRGLLCSTCNTGIGMLKEDPDIMRAAIGYLTNRQG